MERPLPPDALLRHATFVRSLARHLLRDPSDADDATQETWRASIESPPRSRPRAWLSKVLRNAIRQQQRSRHRRAQRERRAARDERVESTADAVARIEILKRVVDAVCALQEPYRAAIIMRYYDDLAPREIAARVAAPVETVKSRLKRGRAQLRAALEGSGIDWRMALVPVGGLGPVAANAIELGVSAMSTKLKTALAAMLCLALGAAGLLAVLGALDPRETSPDVVADGTWEESDSKRPTLAGDAQAKSRRPATGARPAARIDPSDRESAASAPLEVSDERVGSAIRGARTVTGVVTDAGRAPSRGTVRFVDPARVGTYESVVLDAAGTFRIEHARTGTLSLIVDLEGRQPRRMSVSVPEAADPETVEVTFGTATVWGFAYDGLGRPAEGVQVSLSAFLEEGPEGYASSAEGDVFHVTQTTGIDGRYEFRDLPRGTYIVIGRVATDPADAARNMRSHRLTLDDGEIRQLDVGGPHEDPVWSGVVRYVDGTPVERTGNIFLARGDGEHRMYVSFDNKGRFSEQVPVGTYRAELVMSTPDPRDMSMRLVQTDQEIVVGYHGLEEDLVYPGARLTGTLSGTIEPSQVLTFEREKTHEPVPSSLIARTPKTDVTVPVAADGSFAVDGLLPGTYTVAGSPKSLAGSSPMRIEVPAGRAVVILALDLRE